MVNKYLSIIVLVAAFFIGFDGIMAANYLFNKNSKTITQSPSPIAPLNEQVLSASTKNNTSKNHFRAQVKIIDLNKKPNAFEIKLTYDTSIFTVDKIDPGDMWRNTNILFSSIDNKNGIVKYAAGEGFGSSFTKGNNLFVIDFTVKKQANYKFQVSSDSKFGFISSTDLTQVNQSSLFFQIY